MRNLIRPATGILSFVIYWTVTSNAVLAQTTGKIAQEYGHYHGPGMMWGGGHWGGFGMIFGYMFMRLLLAAVIVGIIYLVRSLAGSGSPGMFAGPGHGTDRAINILKERFARGEIDKEEFEERRKLLE